VPWSRNLRKDSLDDMECFTKTIERLETDLDLMRARANAWAKGDVAAIRAMTHVDQATACSAVIIAQFSQEPGGRIFLSVSRMPGLQRLKRRWRITIAHSLRFPSTRYSNPMEWWPNYASVAIRLKIRNDSRAPTVPVPHYPDSGTGGALRSFGGG